VKRPRKRASNFLKRASEQDTSKTTGSVLNCSEARFRRGFLDAPARVELWGFEAWGGGKLPSTRGCTKLGRGREIFLEGPYNLQKLLERPYNPQLETWAVQHGPVVQFVQGPYRSLYS
jgi:hypothetical protein